MAADLRREKAVVILYYRTTRDEAEVILAQGFQEAAKDLSGLDRHTTWVFDHPPDESDRTPGPVVLAVDVLVPDDLLGTYHQSGLVEGQRRFGVPSALLDRFGPPHVVEGP
jgi:hypothetical protein